MARDRLLSYVTGDKLVCGRHAHRVNKATNTSHNTKSVTVIDVYVLGVLCVELKILERAAIIFWIIVTTYTISKRFKYSNILNLFTYKLIYIPHTQSR